ncbi:MAG: hypothetical protein AN483_06820 [Aphanizomenon flos-aquae MDT14a]|jgi:hypothetical protein|nr:MAG: hypothetical protein AN483_06820 [Aphanizomenon flos-aquae MDT14a]
MRFTLLVVRSNIYLSREKKRLVMKSEIERWFIGTYGKDNHKYYMVNNYENIDISTEDGDIELTLPKDFPVKHIPTIVNAHLNAIECGIAIGKKIQIDHISKVLFG